MLMQRENTCNAMKLLYIQAQHTLSLKSKVFVLFPSITSVRTKVKDIY